MAPYPQRRSGHLRLALAIGAALAAGALTVPAAHAATPATATTKAGTKRLHDDFNRDGYPDLAVGAPGTKSADGADTGAVSVLYGSARGLSTSHRQVLDASKEHTGPPVTGYGSALRSADLDGDGYADLLSLVRWTPADGETVNNITVNWGGPKGLSARRTLLLQLPEATATRGFAVGDVNGDGHPDVVTMGDPSDALDGNGVTVLRGPFTRGGPATDSHRYIYDVNGIQTPTAIAAADVNGDGVDDIALTSRYTEDPIFRRSFLLLGGANGLTDKGRLKDPAGHYLGGEDVVIGDLNRDGYGDIVVGHAVDGTDTDVELPTKGGALGVVYGGPAGVSTTRKPVWINQDTAGVPGVGEYHDGMGTGLSIGDTNGDGYLDVATGLPGEDFDGVADAGSVLVLRGSAKGLTGTGAKVFSQNTGGVPGVAEKKDAFGARTALVDANGDRKAELAVGDPAENANNGAVWIFSATSGGITARGSFVFGAATVGAPATGVRFGASLTG